MLQVKYSIKDLEKITGIKAHTIRIWEQRYGILKPERTDTNIRYYDDDDLQFILNVSVLNKSGIKISHIAELPKKNLLAEVRRLTTSTDNHEGQINEMVICMLHMDEHGFGNIINEEIRAKGFESTILHLVYPFLEHIGNLWLTKAIRPTHEHFISNLIRQKIIAAVDSLPQYNTENAKSFLLFTPEKEIHEISLLFSLYLIRSRGLKAYYIGLNIPCDDLLQIAREILPDYLLTTITSNPTGDLLIELLNKIKGAFKEIPLIVSGLQIRQIEKQLPGNTICFESAPAFIEFLDAMKNINKV